jgi:hypothetical protein
VNTTGYESGLSGEDYYGDLSKLSRAEQGITQIVPQTIVGSGAGAELQKPLLVELRYLVWTPQLQRCWELRLMAGGKV